MIDTGLLIDENSAHRPQNKKGRQRKQNDNQKGQSTQSQVTGQLPNASSVDPRAGTLSEQAQLCHTSTTPISSQSMQARSQNAANANQQPPLLTPPTIQFPCVNGPPPQIPVNVHPYMPMQPQRFDVPQGNQGPSITWHAGMSPNPYEVVLLDRRVTKCYGCGQTFAEKFRQSSFNLVLKHVDRRVTGKNSLTGGLIYSNDFSNTYYYLSVIHVKKKNPIFTGLVYISASLYNSLDSGQRNCLNSSGLNIVFC